MLQMNGKGNRLMTTPAPPPPPESKLYDAVNLLGLRLWMLCAGVIVGFGILNWLLNWWIGSVE